MFFRKRNKQEQDEYDQMMAQHRALASQFSSLGGAAAMGQGVNTMGNIYPGISMASMQQQVINHQTYPVMHFRVEFSENGFVVRMLDGNGKSYVCTEPQEVADRILAAMVEFKMEANK